MALPITVRPGEENTSVVIVIGPPGHTIEIPLSGKALDAFNKEYLDAVKASRMSHAPEPRKPRPPKPPPKPLTPDQFGQQYGGTRRISSRWK